MKGATITGFADLKGTNGHEDKMVEAVYKFGAIAIAINGECIWFYSSGG